MSENLFPRALLHLAAGLLFGLGLVVSGMADPGKVLGFLDLGAIPSGGWDPSLAFVMGGAIAVGLPGFRLIPRWSRPWFAAKFELPTRRDIDSRILLGPAIFGVGWGLAGLCPGPAFTALAGGSAAAAGFVLAMLLGMALARWLASR